MNHELLSHHKEHLRQIGIPEGSIPKEVEAHRDEYEAAWDAVRRSHPDADAETVHMKALAHLAWQDHHHKKSPRKDKVQDHRWELRAIVVILVLLFASRFAHCQFSKISGINLQNNDGSTAAYVASPFALKAGANCSYSVSGLTITFNCVGGAAAAGGLNGQVQWNSTGALAGISSMTTDGTVVTQLAGVNYLIVDPVDPTKKFRFDVSGVSGATTRTFTIPNADFTGVIADTGAANNFLTAISAAGVISKARPTCGNLSDSGTLCASSAALAVTKTAVAGSPLLSYDSTTGAFGQGALTWAQINKATSSIADITTRTCSTLSDAGTLCTSSATSFPPTAHNLLSASHGDSTAASPVIGDLITGQTGPVWARLGGNTAATDQVLISHGSGTLAIAPSWGNAPALSATNMNTFPTLNQNTSGSAATLTTPRAIYGNNFDGSAALAQIIASTYGGTGNGFTKFSGPATTEKTFTLPNASAAILTDNADVTVAQGGTGLGTLTAHALYVGNGTTAPNAISVPAADALLYGTAAADPLFKALPTTGTNGCSAASDMLQWNNSTHAFACGTASGSGTVTHTAGALTLNAVVLGAGLADTKASATASDDGTTLTYSGTGGLALTAAGAGGQNMLEGTAPAAAASHDVCYADSTAHMVKCNPNNTGFGNVPLVVGATASAGVTIGSGSSIGATSLCSTTVCPAGRYDVHLYINITTACTTTGTYIPWLGFTDTTGAKTGSSTTTYFCGGGLGVTPCTASAGSILGLATTNNFMTADFVLNTTGAATSAAGSINYGTTATACGSGGPMVGKMYLNVTRLE